MKNARRLPLLFISIAVVILAAVAWIDYHKPRLSSAAQNQYRSNLYTTGLDPNAAPRMGEYRTANLPVAFTVTTPPQSAYFILTFKYRCATACPELWLSQDASPNQPQTSILMQHPLFTAPNLPYVTNNQLSLYQKRVTHPTISDFLQSAPTGELILADSQLIPQLATYGIMATPLEGQDSSISADYILTSYQRPRIFSDWFEFSRRYASPPNHTATFTLTANTSKEPATLDIAAPKATVSQ